MAYSTTEDLYASVDDVLYNLEPIMKNRILFAISALYLVGCNQPSEETVQKPEEHKALFNAVNAPLEKAQNVEQQLLEHAQQQSNDIDRATRVEP